MAASAAARLLTRHLAGTSPRTAILRNRISFPPSSSLPSSSSVRIGDGETRTPPPPPPPPPAPPVIRCARFSSVPPRDRDDDDRDGYEPDGFYEDDDGGDGDDESLCYRHPITGAPVRLEEIGGGLPPGETYPHFLKLPKLKPSIKNRRLRACRTYEGAEKGVRYSPWRMNLICRFVVGMTVPEAINQLKFVRKGKAPLVSKVIQRTSNLASMRDGIVPAQLEVAECFSTRGTMLKRLKIHAKGRSGTLKRRFAHVRLVLREIDFHLRIITARTYHEKKRWYARMRLAELDSAEASEERKEVMRLEGLIKERDAERERERKKKEAEAKEKK